MSRGKMTQATRRLDVPEICYNGDKTILEYVFPDHTRYLMRSKTKVVDFIPETVNDCPIWDSFMWDGLDGSREEDIKMMILKPVAMFENPFFKSPHKLVLCDFWVTPDKPSVINTRYSCKQTMDRLVYDPVTGHRPLLPHDPWFGIEQEYFVANPDGTPVNYHPNQSHYRVICAAIGLDNDMGVGIERQLSDRHVLACVYAGVNIGGSTRENYPSQWEYQIGPCPGETIGDHLHISRYILQRLAEMFGLHISFNPAPVPGTPIMAGGHINFSTRKMREKGGIRFIRHAIQLLANSYDEPLLRFYDPSLTEENKDRLKNTLCTWHPQNQFVCRVGDKQYASVRIPTLVDQNNCGYFEDRRPSSKVDPYAAAEGLVRACIFGEFLKPGNEHLKDLTFWDSEP